MCRSPDFDVVRTEMVRVKFYLNRLECAGIGRRKKRKGGKVLPKQAGKCWNRQKKEA